jgi:hypothetical protein
MHGLGQVTLPADPCWLHTSADFTPHVHAGHSHNLGGKTQWALQLLQDGSHTGHHGAMLCKGAVVCAAAPGAAWYLGCVPRRSRC